MSEFWEKVYSENFLMWGENPTDNALKVVKMFLNRGVGSVLIPGIGYGRNAKAFADAGMEVVGIEISKTAIARAHKSFGKQMLIHHGSVLDMPFDSSLYQGVYCHSLLHLFPKGEREVLIKNCYNKLEPGGVMVFTLISDNDGRFGQGEALSAKIFKNKGLTVHFYDEEQVMQEFADYNILAAQQIMEPIDNPNEIMWMVVCEKP